MTTPTPAPRCHLTPAFTLTAALQAPLVIGPLSTGISIHYVNATSSTITSLPGYTPAFSGTLISPAGDWLELDPDGKFGRINVKGIFKTDDGENIFADYTGILTLSEQFLAFSTFERKETTVEDIVVNMNLRTGSGGRLAVLANRMFVGVGRMLTNEEGVHCIEYTLSELVPDA